MEKVIIRKCEKKDKKDIVNICFHTGYMGEDAKGYFHDKKLFGLLFCAYYPLFEPHNCYVAVTRENNKEKVIGYILSSLDTKNQEKIFIRRFLWRIVFRFFFLTSWRYFQDFKLVLKYFIKSKIQNKESEELSFYNEYPAHLHIDILEKYQNRGIGTKLIKTLETHFKKNKIYGVCMGTSERNYKSIPFYKKNGYKLLKVSKGLGFWPETDNIKSYFFGKKFN